MLHKDLLGLHQNVFALFLLPAAAACPHGSKRQFWNLEVCPEWPLIQQETLKREKRILIFNFVYKSLLSDLFSFLFWCARMIHSYKQTGMGLMRGFCASVTELYLIIM